MVEAWVTFYTHVQSLQKKLGVCEAVFPGGGKLPDDSDGNSDGFHIEMA